MRLIINDCGFAAPIKQYLLTKVQYPILISGKEFRSPDLPILNYEGNTYVPLKALGDMLGTTINWNNALKRIEIGDPIAQQPENEVPQSNEDTNKRGSLEEEELKKVSQDFDYFKSIFKSGERVVTTSDFILTTADYNGVLSEDNFFTYWDSLNEDLKKAHMLKYTKDIQNINPEYTIRIDFNYKAGINLGTCTINLQTGFVGAAVSPNPRGLQKGIK